MKVHEGLYIGSCMAEMNKKHLFRAGITDILQVAQGLFPHHPLVFNYMNIQVQDAPSEDMVQYFPKCFEFIDRGISKGGNVLVHCAAGVSRSATVVLGYLMARYRMELTAALEHLKAVRPWVCPNTGFMQQLETYQSLAHDMSKWRSWHLVWREQQQQVQQTGQQPQVQQQQQHWIEIRQVQAQQQQHPELQQQRQAGLLTNGSTGVHSSSYSGSSSSSNPGGTTAAGGVRSNSSSSGVLLLQQQQQSSIKGVGNNCSSAGNSGSSNGVVVARFGQQIDPWAEDEHAKANECRYSRSAPAASADVSMSCQAIQRSCLHSSTTSADCTEQQQQQRHVGFLELPSVCEEPERRQVAFAAAAAAPVAFRPALGTASVAAATGNDSSTTTTAAAVDANVDTVMEEAVAW